MLDKRLLDVLKVVVDEFIETAEPVSSKTLKEKYKLPNCSSTLRNDMAILEQEGFLEKPHTSAGRIPTPKGYQFYCDHLLERDLDDDLKHSISEIFSKTINVEDAIKESCKIITDMTNLTSGVLGPDQNNQTLEHVEIVPIDTKSAVCLLVTNTGHTENKLFKIDGDVSSEDIKKCTDILNERLKGTPIIQLEEKLTSLKPILSQAIKKYEVLFNAFLSAFTKFASNRMYVNGASNLVYQPEFTDINNLKKILSLCDNPQILKEVVSKDNDTEVMSFIPNGPELIWKDDLAIVSSQIRVGKEDNGRIIVLGPRRMEYNRVVSLVDFIAKQIEEIYK